MRLIASAATLIAVGAMTVAGTIRHDRVDSQYVDIAGRSQFAPYGPIRRASNNSIVCSGTLITPRFILAPAHCVDFITAPGDFKFEAGGQFFPLAEIILNPEWPAGDPNPAPSDDGADLALVRLASPVTAITPAQRYRGTAEVGLTATYIGYGDTGTGLTGGQQSTAGTRRAGVNDIDALGNLFTGFSNRLILSDFDHPTNASLSVIGGTAPQSLEYMLALRDSGAGVFIQTGGQWYLAAVGSFIIEVNANGKLADYGDLCASTRVTSHQAWIDATVCPEDGNGDHAVDVTDLLSLLAAWGPCPLSAGSSCPHDLDGNGAVEVNDLLAMLAAWGACP